MPNFEIKGGVIKTAKKVVIYGTEGIGKTTLAAHFPEPLFIDTEGSTNHLDVKRLPKPTSWQQLKDMVDFVAANKPCKSLVIDTIDWAEQLCIAQLCDKAGKSGIEDFGYGSGYVNEKEAFERFLTQLDKVITAGINVVLTAHAILKKFEQPDEMGAYDRYQMKLGKLTTNHIAPMVKEWADMVLFCNYKTYAVAVDDKGKKHKAQGGKRVMYTVHHPCWDAKNRYGLPEEVPMDYSAIAHIIEDIPAGNTQHTAQSHPEPQNKPVLPADDTNADKVQEPPENAAQNATATQTPATVNPDYAGLPQALIDLMSANSVSEENIRTVVSQKGYLPYDMPVKNYPTDFINGVLIGAWEQVKKMIDETCYPFD